MREHVLHFAWGISHVLRSAVEGSSTNNLVHQLSVEVQTLQAELHRTQRVLSGYSNILEACERGSRGQSWVNGTFLLVFVILGSILVCSWFRPRPKPTSLAVLSLGDTGGSSDSDQPELPVVKKGGSGPVRPSSLGKGPK